GAVWDLESGKPLGLCAGHGASICALHFPADGKQLVSGDQVGSYTVGRQLTWDLTRGVALESLPREVNIKGRLDDEYAHAERTPDGKYLFAQTWGLRGENRTVVAHDAKT